MSERIIGMAYVNWRGEDGYRRIIPNQLVWDKTEWHPEYQWLLEAFDTEKGEMRLFALSECNFQRSF